MPATSLLTVTALHRPPMQGEVPSAFRVVPNCEHEDESCECICSCNGRVWHDHASELWGPVNWDLPGQTECTVICPGPPIYYASNSQLA